MMNFIILYTVYYTTRTVPCTCVRTDNKTKLKELRKVMKSFRYLSHHDSYLLLTFSAFTIVFFSGCETDLDFNLKILQF